MATLGPYNSDGQGSSVQSKLEYSVSRGATSYTVSFSLIFNRTNTYSGSPTNGTATGYVYLNGSQIATNTNTNFTVPNNKSNAVLVSGSTTVSLDALSSGSFTIGYSCTRGNTASSAYFIVSTKTSNSNFVGAYATGVGKPSISITDNGDNTFKFTVTKGSDGTNNSAKGILNAGYSWNVASGEWYNLLGLTTDSSYTSNNISFTGNSGATSVAARAQTYGTYNDSDYNVVYANLYYHGTLGTPSKPVVTLNSDSSITITGYWGDAGINNAVKWCDLYYKWNSDSVLWNDKDVYVKITENTNGNYSYTIPASEVLDGTHTSIAVIAYGVATYMSTNNSVSAVTTLDLYTHVGKPSYTVTYYPETNRICLSITAGTDGTNNKVTNVKYNICKNSTQLNPGPDSTWTSEQGTQYYTWYGNTSCGETVLEGYSPSVQAGGTITIYFDTHLDATHYTFAIYTVGERGDTIYGENSDVKTFYQFDYIEKPSVSAYTVHPYEDTNVKQVDCTIGTSSTGVVDICGAKIYTFLYDGYLSSNTDLQSAVNNVNTNTDSGINSLIALNLHKSYWTNNVTAGAGEEHVMSHQIQIDRTSNPDIYSFIGTNGNPSGLAFVVLAIRNEYSKSSGEVSLCGSWRTYTFNWKLYSSCKIHNVLYPSPELYPTEKVYSTFKNIPICKVSLAFEWGINCPFLPSSYKSPYVELYNADSNELIKSTILESLSNLQMGKSYSTLMDFPILTSGNYKIKIYFSTSSDTTEKQEYLNWYPPDETTFYITYTKAGGMYFKEDTLFKSGIVWTNISEDKSKPIWKPCVPNMFKGITDSTGTKTWKNTKVE